MLSGIDIGSQTSSALSNPVAAVPSLHAAYALGVGIGIIRFAHSHLARLAGALYPPLVVLTIVVTGNHFLLDAVAGMLVLALGFMLVRALRRAPRRATASLRRLTRPSSRGIRGPSLQSTPRRGVEQPGSSPGS